MLYLKSGSLSILVGKTWEQTHGLSFSAYFSSLTYFEMFYILENTYIENVFFFFFRKKQEKIMPLQDQKIRNPLTKTNSCRPEKKQDIIFLNSAVSQNELISPSLRKFTKGTNFHKGPQVLH